MIEHEAWLPNDSRPREGGGLLKTFLESSYAKLRRGIRLLLRTLFAAGAFAALVYAVLQLNCPSSLMTNVHAGIQISAAPTADPAPLESVGSPMPHVDEAQQEVGAPALVSNRECTRILELNRLLTDRSLEAADSLRAKLAAWAETDAPAAAAWASTLKDDPVRSIALEQVAIGWANSDLSAAAQWVRSLPADAAKEAAVLGLANEASRTDPLTALEAAGELPVSRERDLALTHAVSQWAGNDSSAALQWVGQVSDPQLRQALLSAVAVACSETAPAAAATLSASLLDSGPGQANTVISVVERWAETAPQAAADWVLEFPEGSTRATAIDNLVAVWVSHDPAGAQQWVRDLPQGSLHDTALAAYDRATVPVR